MKYIYNDELYGEVTYSRMYSSWKKTTPFLLPFNGKECSIVFYIEFVDELYLKTKYNISHEFKLEEINREQIEDAEKWEKEQRELYKKYLMPPSEMMRLVEDAIVADYQWQMKENYGDEAECVKFLGEKKAKKVMNADNREKILNLVKLKKLILVYDGIVILGKCDWYDTNYGIKVTSEGFVKVGLEENVY